MVTLKQFEIYKKFYGDGDMFQRSGSKKQKQTMANFNWVQINTLLQDLYLVYNNQSSDEYRDKTLKLLDSIASEQIIKEKIIEYSQKLPLIQQEYNDLLKKWI